ncbi:DUF6220 domain-containing protein [Microtetraspora niveoalba]|uniref:DUF6220 domain-containing protein n=1 Tax=Microtetraspora niveoalba TaxID=46175 RepID=UPI00082F0A2F|nr:DUF6220 domain-containing protein [Microtetraspora niveoalba]
MRKVYYGFTVVQLVAVLVLFYLVTFGAFERPAKLPGAEGALIDYHIIVGEMVVPLLSLLTTIVAAIARVGGRLVGLSITPFALVVVQLFVVFSLAELAGHTDGQSTTGGLIVLGFHSLVGVSILAVAAALVRRARALVKGAVPVAPVAATRGA